VKQKRTRNLSRKPFLLIILLFLVVLSCTKKTGEPTSPQISLVQLQISTEVFIDILEPSGLTRAWNNEGFLVVSDHTNKIYQISYSGEVLNKLSFTGQDLEGICYQEAGKIIWVVDEKQNKLFKLNKQGEKELEYTLSYESHPQNKGLEGIAINTNNNHIFMLNESSPGLLLEFFDGNIIRTVSLNFSKDYSGLYFDAKNNQLWMLSDESQNIYQCALDGELLKTYHHQISKAEGLVVDVENMEFWVVSDSDNKLYKLRIKQ